MNSLPLIRPSYATSLAVQNRVLTARFGDGRIQRAADGGNSQDFRWNVVWENRENADIQTLYDFLIATRGVESFFWQPPTADAAQKFIVDGRISYQPLAYGYSTLSATFLRVFDL